MGTHGTTAALHLGRERSWPFDRPIRAANPQRDLGRVTFICNPDFVVARESAHGPNRRISFLIPATLLKNNNRTMTVSSAGRLGRSPSISTSIKERQKSLDIQR